MAATKPPSRTLPERAVRAIAREVDDLLGRGPWFTHQPLGPNLDPARLDGYYCDFRHKADIPREPGDLLGPAARRYFNGEVIPISQCALGTWELLVEGREELREDFLSAADTLVDLAVPGPRGQGLAWYTPLKVEKYGLHEPWPSAMGQGEAISVLLRAHRLSGDERYAEVARQAFAPLTLDVSEGGVSRRINGHLVLEEYPIERPVAVLNGWIFALFGLHELAGHAHPPAGEVFEESLAGLLALLPCYDVGWWSLYSLDRAGGMADLAKPFYQRLHPVMLRALHRIRPDERLVMMAERWERQLTRPALARTLANKVVYRGARHVRASPRLDLKSPGAP